MDSLWCHKWWTHWLSQLNKDIMDSIQWQWAITINGSNMSRSSNTWCRWDRRAISILLWANKLQEMNNTVKVKLINTLTLACSRWAEDLELKTVTKSYKVWLRDAHMSDVILTSVAERIWLLTSRKDQTTSLTKILRATLENILLIKEAQTFRFKASSIDKTKT